MKIQGTYTNKGLALTAKTAVGACLRVTRVVGGSGHTTDVPNAAQLPEIRQTLAVGEARCTGDTAVLPVTLAAVEMEDSYTLTELGIYAEDPDEGEILYCVYRLDEPVTIQAGSDTVLRFYLRQTVSEDGGATVLCSPAGLITESDCAPVRKMVLAVGAPYRYVSISAAELQDYINSLPRLLTEHHVITLRGTNSNIVSVKDFYGCGSLTLRADKVGDCVFTKDVIVGNCSIPVIMEGLKWELDGTASPETYCISCRDSTIYANICSFNGHAKTGRGVVSWGNSSAVLAGCALHNLEIAIEASWGGRIGVYGEDPKTECSGNAIGIYLRQGGLVLLGDLVPDLLGGTYNERNGMNAIIKGGKFV
nr:MAG TPA: tail-collar fiber protein [Caudoviricetes sp.]